MGKSQEIIKKDVIDQIYWDARVDASNVVVEVEDGTVTLSGSVPNYDAREAAENDAWSIEGVKWVDNQIKVKFPRTRKIPSDSEIKTSAETSLSLNGNIDSTTIDVSVNNGIVTLEGTVDAYWKKFATESGISGVNGVTSIENKLSIVPTKSIEDESIAEEIMSSLSRKYNVNEEEIDVKVVNGEATLSGTVDSWKAYNEAMDAARYTLGVKDVNDDLVIKI